MMAGAPAVRDWSSWPGPPRDRDRGLEELIEGAGGVSALARQAGVHRSTIGRLRSGRTDPARVRAPTREALAGVNAAANDTARREAAAATWAPILERFGGTGGLAAASGLSQRQIQRYVAGEAQPRSEALRRLRRADRRYRMSRTPGSGFATPPTPPAAPPSGRVVGPRYRIRATGRVRVHDPSYRRDYSYTSRSIGDTGIEIPSDLVGEIQDAVVDGDSDSAMHALQGWLSEDYAASGVGAYDPEEGIGFFLEEIDTFSLEEFDGY